MLQKLCECIVLSIEAVSGWSGAAAGGGECHACRTVSAEGSRSAGLYCDSGKNLRLHQLLLLFADKTQLSKPKHSLERLGGGRSLHEEHGTRTLHCMMERGSLLLSFQEAEGRLSSMVYNTLASVGVDQVSAGTCSADEASGTGEFLVLEPGEIYWYLCVGFTEGFSLVIPRTGNFCPDILQVKRL